MLTLIDMPSTRRHLSSAILTAELDTWVHKKTKEALKKKPSTSHLFALTFNLWGATDELFYSIPKEFTNKNPEIINIAMQTFMLSARVYAYVYISSAKVELSENGQLVDVLLINSEYHKYSCTRLYDKTTKALLDRVDPALYLWLETEMSHDATVD